MARFQALSRDKIVLIVPETGKDKPDTGCVCYLLVRNCSKPKDHFYTAEQESRDYVVHETAFTNSPSPTPHLATEAVDKVYKL